MTEKLKIQKIGDVNFRTLLREGELRSPPLEIRASPPPDDAPGDAMVEVAWRGHTCRFVVELKRDSRPQTLKLAIDQVTLAARKAGAEPMVVAPYLSEEKLEWLLNEGVSGVDFCGNAAVEAPGQFLFWRSGNPNQFRDSVPLQSAYRGDSSLVARVLLLEPQFETVGQILETIRHRGGSLTLGTVSKGLKRLEADLVIERPNGRSVRLMQPHRLLNRLLDAYQPPKVANIWLGKVDLAEVEILARLERIGSDGSLVRTGAASAGAYAAYAGEPIVACYCRARPEAVLERIDAHARETRTFPNLRMIQTEDQRVYFDRRAALAASPIQAWLEMASGDKRQQQAAAQIRRSLVASTGAKP